MTNIDIDVERCLSEGPQSTLERRLIKQHLLSQGYHPADLEKLPKEVARELMIKACRYASLKLAEVESRARFQQKIHGSSKGM
jgi:hypothetical protein